MRTPPPDLIAAVEQAAELRAGGFPWKQVAQELDRPYTTVVNWPQVYYEFWADCLAAARAELRAGAADEARAVFRTHLRSTDEKVQRDAARELIAAAAPIPTSLSPRRSDLHRLADFLEGLSDDDRRTLLGDQLPEDPVGPAVQAGLGPAAPGP